MPPFRFAYFGAGPRMAGAVLLSCLLAAPFAPAQAEAGSDAARGGSLFAQRCAMCHSVSGKGGKAGPDLTTVAGRKAASTAYAYSPALKKLNLSWTAANRDAYLAAPAKVAPGNRMPLAIPKADDRRAIIAYLGSRK
ncbi:Class I cytochrome c [Sphingomonas paucimobilis]|nr:Class I cytochrome c [Sphingomonas paucimobilis]